MMSFVLKSICDYLFSYLRGWEMMWREGKGGNPGKGKREEQVSGGLRRVNMGREGVEMIGERREG